MKSYTLMSFFSEKDVSAPASASFAMHTTIFIKVDATKTSTNRIEALLWAKAGRGGTQGNDTENLGRLPR